MEVIVAVVDSGVSLDHPEFTGKLWSKPGELPNGVDDDGNGYVDDRNGWDFFDNDSVPLDENGHGTLVASLIGAVSNNADGISGVSPRVRIMALRAGSELG